VISFSLTNNMTRYSVKITRTRLTLLNRLALWKYSVYV